MLTAALCPLGKGPGNRTLIYDFGDRCLTVRRDRYFYNNTTLIVCQYGTYLLPDEKDDDEDDGLNPPPVPPQPPQVPDVAGFGAVLDDVLIEGFDTAGAEEIDEVLIVDDDVDGLTDAGAAADFCWMTVVFFWMIVTLFFWTTVERWAGGRLW